MANELPTEAGWYWWRKDDDDEWVHRIVIAQGPRIIVIRLLPGYTGEQIVKVWLLSKIQDEPAYGQWFRIPGPDEIMEMQAALNDISCMRECMGPGCIHCDDGTEHPPSPEARIAMEVLRDKGH